MAYNLLIEYNIQNDRATIMTMEEGLVPSDLIIWGWDHFSQQPIYAPADAPFPVNKFDRHFNHKRKVLFESTMAVLALQNSALFLPVLSKISHSMVDFLQKKHYAAKKIGNEQQFLETAGPCFSHYLYPRNKHFGRLGDAENSPDHPVEVYRQAINSFASGKNIENILTAFMAMPALLEKIRGSEQDCLFKLRDKDIRSKLLTRELFENRGIYTSKKHHLILTEACGITEKSDQLPCKITPHYRALDHTVRDVLNVSDFAFQAFQREIPFVSGASGHTVLLLRAMLNFGTCLSQEELQQVSFLCAAFLIVSGAHSFHEVFSVAKNIGAIYDVGRYEAAMPAVFKTSPAYQFLLNDFPDIIAPPIHTNENLLFKTRKRDAAPSASTCDTSKKSRLA